jgi:predicted nucleic acid-binding protein
VPFVLDASATLAALLPDEASAISDAIVDRLLSSRAVVPTVWPSEIANALLVAERRRRITEALVGELIAQVRLLPIDVDDASTDAVFTSEIALARRYELSVYDASYLEVALRRGIPLATVDRRLEAAARAAGIALVPA